MKVLLIILGVILFIAVLLHFPVYAELSYLDGKPGVKIKYLFFKLDIIEMMKKKKPGKPGKKKKRRKKPAPKPTEANSKPDSEPACEPACDPVSEPVTDESQEDILPDKPEDTAQDVGEFTGSDKDKDKGKDKGKDKDKDADDEAEKPKNSFFDKLNDKLELVSLLWGMYKKNIVRILKTIRISGVDFRAVAAGEDACAAAVKYGRINAVFYETVDILRKFMKVSLKKVLILCSYSADRSEYGGSFAISIRPSAVIANGFAMAVKTIFRIKTILKLLRS